LLLKNIPVSVCFTLFSEAKAPTIVSKAPPFPKAITGTPHA